MVLRTENTAEGKETGGGAQKVGRKKKIKKKKRHRVFEQANFVACGPPDLLNG